MNENTTDTNEIDYSDFQPAQNKRQESPPKCISCDKALTQDEIKVYQCSCGSMETKHTAEFIDNKFKVKKGGRDEI